MRGSARCRSIDVRTVQADNRGDGEWRGELKLADRAMLSSCGVRGAVNKLKLNRAYLPEREVYSIPASSIQHPALASRDPTSISAHASSITLLSTSGLLLCLQSKCQPEASENVLIERRSSSWTIAWKGSAAARLLPTLALIIHGRVKIRVY